MILMALGTFSIGLIPAYERIGIWAPVLLLLARVVQGFSTGGEYGGAATFIAEYSTDRNRGLMGSWLELHRRCRSPRCAAEHMLAGAGALPGGRPAGPARPVHAHEAGGNPGVPRLRRGSREA